MSFETPPPIPAEAFERRRGTVLERLGSDVMVLPASPVQHASRDNERPYVPDRELYYLTGLTQPSSVAVLVGGDEKMLVIFVAERDDEAELWAGPRLGPADVEALVDGAECHPLSELDSRLPALLSRANAIHYRLGRRDALERLVIEALERARARGQRTGSGPRALVDPGEILDDLRLVKDEHEIRILREACRVTVEGHRAGAGAIRVGVGEWRVEAAIEGAFRAARAGGPGFDTIVGSGANSCVLHYVDNGATVPEQGLVLVDAGAEVALYNGDVTRTYPATGRFDARQLEVYAIVEEALRAGVEAVRPGSAIDAVHEAVIRTLTHGLEDLGILEGDLDGLIEQSAYKPFYPHQTSHWLGLDVHDPGDYARNGEARRLEPGMVFTVEPGLYFRPGTERGRADDFAGIGVRLEDDVVVTEAGCEVLTAGLPTSPGEVEALVAP